MPPDMKQAIHDAVKEALKPLEARFDKINRWRNIAWATAILCLVGASGSVGYAIKSNEALSDQTNTNRIVVCANARSTALAFREPQISSSGRKETKNHFLNRIVGQRETLLASGHLDCPEIPGFDTFEYLRGKALAEIDRILLKQAPHKAHKLGVTPTAGALGVVSTPQPTVAAVTVNPDESESAESPSAPSHHQSTGGNTGTGGGSHHGSGGHHHGGHPVPTPEPAPSPEPAPEPEAEPEQESPGKSGESNAGGNGNGKGEPKLLPEVVDPVEGIACKSPAGKLVCAE